MDYPHIDLYEFLTEAELQHYYNAVKNELKITNASQFKYATDEDLKSVGMSRPEIRRLRKFYEKHFPHGYLSKIKRLLQTPSAIVKRGSGNGGSGGVGGGSDEGLINNTNASNAISAGGSTLTSLSGAINKVNNSPNKVPNNKHIIPADAISVNKQLGTGEFGIVQQGVWTNGTERIQVAIKCLCRERVQSSPMEFLKEAAIMHAIEHENIVRLYGVVLAIDSLMLVTELAHLRSLLECLKDGGLRVNFLTVPTLCEFALQICNGMRYLENNRLIHRDLAARNILVFSKNKVKISDFGLSRALGVGKDYYKTNFNVNLKLPIAWCAPECINFLRFTNASDVWAYGVCLWEMFSYGFQPWAALTGLQILEAIDTPNYQRLEQPECCPREYYTLMMRCWQDDATKRPKFGEIYDLLPEMKPEQLKAVDNCLEAKTNEHLIYRQNDIITVLDRSTGTPYWKGVLNSGKTGLFNPSNTVAYVEGLPSLNRDSFSRNASDRCSKRKLRTEMISKPQNDFKHTGHVGIDGASFGDIAFLGSSQNYNHVPRQIVTPYKPSEDIEQTPLLLPPTPTSPDSLQTASGYFANHHPAHYNDDDDDDDDERRHNTSTMNPSFVPSTENTPKHFTNAVSGQIPCTFEFPTQSLNTGDTNPFTVTKTTQDNVTVSGRCLENKGQRTALSWLQMGGFEESHEYHEISDKENGGGEHEHNDDDDDDDDTADKLDFGPSLMDEINSMFGSISAAATMPSSTNPANNNNRTILIQQQQQQDKIVETDNATTLPQKRNDFCDLTSKLIRKNSAGGSTKKHLKHLTCDGTVKSISVKDEKILNQAIEIANEISARSMCSLVSDQAPPPLTQSPKRKFSFRFPHLTSLATGGSGTGSSGCGGGGSDKTQHNNNVNNNNSAATGAGHLNTLSPHSKKKNFTEELRSIPDLQSFPSRDSSLNITPAVTVATSDIHLPLFDKETSDFCFQKSRELLTRPLNFPTDSHECHAAETLRGTKQMTLEENLFDIENTLKALNMDFMHTYTDVDKTDSDDTILNDQFSSIVSSIDEEFSSATGVSLKSATGVFNYNNGRNTTTTTFDFKAATSHLDKHLQYMKSAQGNSNSNSNNGCLSEKRPSTPDTGFASRDTNISLSRRSSQKSNFSPQDSYCSTKELMSTPCRNASTFHNTNEGLTAIRPNTIFSNYDAIENRTPTCINEPSQNTKLRLRSMSFTDYLNPMSRRPLTETYCRSVARTKTRHSQSSDDAEDISKRRPFYKSRSIRARTLRRLSYNPLTAAATSSTSSSTDDEDPEEMSEKSIDGSVVRSECDIRTRSRRRRHGWTRKLISSPQPATDRNEEEMHSGHSRLYGSNVSIKSAPHYNNYTVKVAVAGRGNNRTVSAAYKPNAYDEKFPYEERIYDFGGGNDGRIKNCNSKTNKAAAINAPPTNIQLETQPIFTSGGNSGSGSGSSSVPYNGIYPEFDVSRLTGLSPTSSQPPPFPQTQTKLEFQWPEKIHASAIKQNDFLWRQQQQQQQQQQQFPDYDAFTEQPLSAASSSPTDSDRYEFHSEYVPARLPPSPAP